MPEWSLRTEALMSTAYNSIEEQFLRITTRHALYPAIDPGTALRGAASGKVVFLSGASQGYWAGHGYRLCPGKRPGGLYHGALGKRP